MFLRVLVDQSLNFFRLKQERSYRDQSYNGQFQIPSLQEYIDGKGIFPLNIQAEYENFVINIKLNN